MGAPSLLVMLLVMLAVFAAALVLGQVSSIAGTMFSQRPLLLAGLPMVLLLGLFFLLNRPLLLMVILLARAGLDPILDMTKLPIGGGMGIGAILNGLILVLTVSMVLEKGPKRLKLAWFILPFVLIMAVGVARSPQTGEAFKAMLSIVTCYSAFVIGTYMSGSKEKADNVIKIILYSSFLPSLMGLVMWVTDFRFATSQSFDGFEDAEAGRFSGPFTHPNILAFYTLVVMAATLYLWRTYRHTNKLWVNMAAPVYLLVLVLFMLLTKTRSAWAACAMLFFLYGVFFERRFLVYLGVGLLCSLAVPSVQERVADALQETSYLQYAKLNSYAWRTLLWEQALAWLPPNKYLTGMGFASFKHYSAEFFEMGRGIGVGAHNVYLEAFFELGAVGLLAFVLMLAYPALRIALRVLRVYRMLGAMAILVITLYALICYSDNMQFYLVVNLYFWLLVGAVMSVQEQQVDEVLNLHRG